VFVKISCPPVRACRSQAYGMSESTGPHAINNITKGFAVSSAGKTIPGCITKISNPDREGNGEVLCVCLFIRALKSSSFFFKAHAVALD